MKNLKSISYSFFIIFALATIALVGTTSSCSQKSGCPAQDAHVKPNKKGEYATKRGKSNLFPKTMRKKM
ncbi:MAG: hypothetical protein KA010_03225 [Saprospiraceae bacterium]|nr:hypothetical protein [Saprospiraceae bacterium]